MSLGCWRNAWPENHGLLPTLIAASWPFDLISNDRFGAVNVRFLRSWTIRQEGFGAEVVFSRPKVGPNRTHIDYAPAEKRGS